MKRLLLIIFTISFACAQAQTIPTRTATSFTINGLKVIFKPTVKEVISVRMYYRGGVYNYPASQAGIEGFALKATTQSGTKKYTANAFRDIADKYGIDIGGSSTHDYGNIGMDCVKQYFDQGWNLFTEAINNPVFEPNEVQLLRSKMITQINGQQGDPDKRVEELLIRSAFAGTPYATNPDGSAESLTAISPANLRSYYTGLINKNRMFIVIAGNITRDEVERKIKASFATLPSRPYKAPNINLPVWTENHLDVEGKQLATNYISGAFNAPPVNSPNFLAYRLAISALGGSLFNELRTQLNLSYDPGASAVSSLMSYGNMHVSTNDPKQAVEAMVRVLSRVKVLGLSEEGVKYLKGSFITSNYIKQQGSGAITANLGMAEINGGWESAEKLPEMLDKITVDQINGSLTTYINGIRWVYLGDPKLAAAANEAFSTAVH